MSCWPRMERMQSWCGDSCKAALLLLLALHISPLLLALPVVLASVMAPGQQPVPSPLKPTMTVRHPKLRVVTVGKLLIGESCQIDRLHALGMLAEQSCPLVCNVHASRAVTATTLICSSSSLSPGYTIAARAHAAFIQSSGSDTIARVANIRAISAFRDGGRVGGAHGS